MAFLEEVLPVTPGFQSDNEEGYSLDIQETSNGYEYLAQRHPLVRFSCSLVMNNRSQSAMQETLRDLFHRASGGLDGFRFFNWIDYSTNDYDATPTYNDQLCELVSAGVYQIIRWYGIEGAAGAARRRIRKPKAASVLVGIRDDSQNPVLVLQGYTVSYTTGEITFDANNSKAITDITLAAQAVVTVGSSHGYVADDSVHFSSVVGMTEINGLRGTVQSVGATTITVDIDSTLFTAYTSGGNVNTRPQANESVTAGCTFDIPVRFASPSDVMRLVGKNGAGFVLSSTIDLVEILNA